MRTVAQHNLWKWVEFTQKENIGPSTAVRTHMELFDTSFGIGYDIFHFVLNKHWLPVECEKSKQCILLLFGKIIKIDHGTITVNNEGLLPALSFNKDKN